MAKEKKQPSSIIYFTPPAMLFLGMIYAVLISRFSGNIIFQIITLIVMGIIYALFCKSFYKEVKNVKNTI